MTLIPDIDYWRKSYPKRDADGNIVATNWRQASANLKAGCLSKGMFQVENVRSSGFWKEGNQILVKGIICSNR